MKIKVCDTWEFGIFVTSNIFTKVTWITYFHLNCPVNFIFVITIICHSSKIRNITNTLSVAILFYVSYVKLELLAQIIRIWNLNCLIFFICGNKFVMIYTLSDSLFTYITYIMKYMSYIWQVIGILPRVNTGN